MWLRSAPVQLSTPAMQGGPGSKYESSEVIDSLLPVTFYFNPSTMLDNVQNFWRFVIIGRECVWWDLILMLNFTKYTVKTIPIFTEKVCDRVQTEAFYIGIR